VKGIQNQAVQEPHDNVIYIANHTHKGCNLNMTFICSYIEWMINDNAQFRKKKIMSPKVPTGAKPISKMMEPA
jgi:hypothetical protein